MNGDVVLLQRLEEKIKQLVEENLNLIAENRIKTEEENKLKLDLNIYRFPTSHEYKLVAVTPEPDEIEEEKKTQNLKSHDIIVNIDSLKEIKWKIENNLTEEQKFILFKGEKTKGNIVIGVLGREKVGKTYLMGKLANLILPEGYDNFTKGLSVKYTTKDNLVTVCLDSAGINSPVYYNDKKILEKFKKDEIYEKNDLRMNMINDKKLTEAFIEDFILNVSKVVIIVVGILSREDQIIVERVKREYKEGKKILIIHNYSLLSSEASLQERVEKDIKLAFKVREEIIPKTDFNKFYVEELEEDSKNKYHIVHFVIAQENTPIGHKYNKMTLDYIWKIITSIDQRMVFDLVKNLKSFFDENCNKYYKLSSYFNQTDKPIELYEEDNYIKLKNPKNIPLFTQDPIFTALGSMIIGKTYDFDPSYILVEKEPNYYLYEIEVPNLVEDSLIVEIIREDAKGSFDCPKVILYVKGQKKNLDFSPENHCLLHGNSKYGTFLKFLEIGKAIDNYEIISKKYDKKNGVIQIKYKKKLKKPPIKL